MADLNIGFPEEVLKFKIKGESKEIVLRNYTHSEKIAVKELLRDNKHLMEAIEVLLLNTGVEG